MNTDDQIKQVVKEKYGEIAIKQQQEGCGCCGTSKVVDYSMFKDNYENLDGYVADADLGLGCGLPTEFADIQKGDTVVDLGSGAGNDVFVARAVTGDQGKVIGIDMTEEMVAKANENKNKLGFNNVEFRQGDIENMPVTNDVADVIVSNCVLNLVPDKEKVISEIYRTLRPGGHFSISDIVLVGDLPETLKKDAEMYAGCVSGAIQKDDYLGYIVEQGFEEVSIQKEKEILIPDDILRKYLYEEALKEFKRGEIGIFSITVFAKKPGSKLTKKKVNLSEIPVLNRCEPGSGCC